MKNNLITLTDKMSVTAEAYRTLRTNIQFSSYDKDLQVVTVTSSRPGEGKSTVSSNLAITFAENGSKVLLVDCDLRRPTIHKVFRLPNSKGMVNAVLSTDPLDKIIHKDIIPGLDIITSGIIPPNPSELLGSKKNQKLMEELKSQYDIIILDAPPLLAVTDAQVLTTMSDGTIIVAYHGVTHKDELVNAKSLLERVKGNVIGVVLNAVPEDDSSYYYYSYEEKKKSPKK